MLTINIAIIFAFGLAISGIVLKGTLLAQEYEEKDENYAHYLKHATQARRI